MIRKLIDFLTLGVAWFRRNRKIRMKAPVVKVNLGSGLTVADGWINIDGSLSAFLSNFPKPFLKVLYRFVGSKRWYTKSEFINSLKKHTFIHHNLILKYWTIDQNRRFLLKQAKSLEIPLKLYGKRWVSWGHLREFSFLSYP